MENLPVVAIRNIVKYLEIEDIIACCSTSKSWRVVFNQDHVWRPFCMESLAHHLRVTECRVEPWFESPEPEDTLGPICEWRRSYMREVHLWGNWSNGRTLKEPIRTDHNEDEYEFFKFINSDRLLIKLKHETRVMLWDVKGAPFHLYDPVTLEFDECVELCEIIEDRIVFLQQNKIQIYRMNDSATVAWELRGVYNLSFNVSLAFVMSNILVALNYPSLNRNRENMLEIFDLDKCETLKTVESPREGTGHFKNIANIIQGEKGSMHFTLLLSEEEDTEDHVSEDDISEDELFDMYIYIYSIEKLDFINFNITVSLPELWMPYLYCCVDKEFLVVFKHGSIQIYKYLTSQLVLDAPNKFSLAKIKFPFRNHSFSIYLRDEYLEEDSEIMIEEPRMVFIDTKDPSLLPVDFHSLRHKAYDVAKLLEHVKEHSDLPREVFGIGLLTAGSNVCDTYTKGINKIGPQVVTFW